MGGLSITVEDRRRSLLVPFVADCDGSANGRLFAFLPAGDCPSCAEGAADAVDILFSRRGRTQAGGDALRLRITVSGAARPATDAQQTRRAVEQLIDAVGAHRFEFVGGAPEQRVSRLMWRLRVVEVSVARVAAEASLSCGGAPAGARSPFGAAADPVAAWLTTLAATTAAEPPASGCA